MGDNYLNRNQQCAAKIEASPGEAETLANTDVKLKADQDDPPFTPDYTRFGNRETAEDAAAAADFVGGKKGSIPVAFAMKSSGTVGTPPALGTYLRACGLKEQIVHAITVGAPSPGGTFAAGATYSAPAGKTGIVEATRAGAGTLRYIVTAGGALAASDVVTVGADTATASGSDALYGVKYTPRSAGYETLTLQRAVKNDKDTASMDFIHRICGALGNAKIDIAALDVARFRADFQGVVALLANGAFFTGVTYEAGDPPHFNNSSVQLDGEAIKVSKFGFETGWELSMEPDPTTSGGANGYDYARFGERSPVLTIDPYRMLVSELDDLGILGSGVTIPFLMSFGTTPQLIEISAPKCQLRGWSPTVRGGRLVAELSLTATRDTLTDNDFSIMFR